MNNSSSLQELIWKFTSYKPKMDFDSKNEMPSIDEACKSADDSDVVSPKTEFKRRSSELESSDNKHSEEPNVLNNEIGDEMPPKSEARRSSDCIDFQSPKTEPYRPDVTPTINDGPMTFASGDETEVSDDVFESDSGKQNAPLTEEPRIQIPKQTHDNTTFTDYRTKGNANPNVPGKPFIKEVTTDYVQIVWEKPVTVSATDTYQVRYKEHPDGKWIFCKDQFEQNQGHICGLKSGTSYIFKVRTVYDDEESPYSDESIVTKTRETLASKLVQTSEIVGNENTRPTKYALPLKNIHGINEKYKTKKYDIGEKSKLPTKEKTIMLLGATGTGKSTLVDGFTNYVLGVNFEDPYRFTVMDVDDREKQTNQALSQTDWVTCYSFNPQVGTRINYKLNVIDTPGFGDTRELERDNHIIKQIRHLFEQPGDSGVQYIDAVCLLVKAQDARLTATQKYIFYAIMSLFGKDIEQNICTLITFADGSEPPVLSAINGCNLPFGDHFTFNNSALFAQTATTAHRLTLMFWEMGMNSFEAFFYHLSTKETKSIQLTSEVLKERNRLEETIENLQPQIDIGLSKIQSIKGEIKIFEEHKAAIEANKNFEYTVTETKQEHIYLLPGCHTTTCMQCNRTCHEDCAFADDDEKRHCCVMDDNGYCTQCPGNCHWRQHKNRPYFLKFRTEKVTKTYQEKLDKFKAAKEEEPSLQKVLMDMHDELENLSNIIEGMMEEINECNNRLKEISLRPNPLGMKEQLQLMIQSEKMEKKDGYMDRISILEGFLTKVEVKEEKTNILVRFSKVMGLK